ncbi:hypothetical protein L211DRAFT_885455 [Terfezia boudieri ATCC MYA-4762]|uniref:Uncharacterized protein n=1 Tax=Terfezia boudieri ATCC MYA-4762 TaxID=1051890 RepID=A0A3N4LHH8_9PEZI|nr:hypothetical protein L211DRAFT_885455 [Terfezia boudieri ATCC MYA-4762]
MHAQDHKIPIVIPRSIPKQESLLHATTPLQTSLSIPSSNTSPPLSSVVTNTVSNSLPQDPRLRPGFDYSESLRLLSYFCRPTSVPWNSGFKARPVVIYRPQNEYTSPHKSRKTTTTQELEPQPNRLQGPAPGNTLRVRKAPVVITDQPQGLTQDKTATTRREARSDGLQDTTPPRDLIRKRKALDVIADQSQGLFQDKTATTRREARSDGLQVTTPPRDLIRKRKATDVITDQSRHQRRPRTLATQTLEATQTLDSKLITLSRNIHDLNFRLRVAGTPPSRIWKECVLYTIDLTSLDKEFELELIINAYFATLEQQKSGLAAWLKMNDDIQHLKGIIRGMAGELLRLDGISN